MFVGFPQIEKFNQKIHRENIVREIHIYIDEASFSYRTRNGKYLYNSFPRLFCVTFNRPWVLLTLTLSTEQQQISNTV